MQNESAGNQVSSSTDRTGKPLFVQARREAGLFFYLPMILLTHEPIDHTALTESVRLAHCGAVVTFLGTVRDITGQEVTTALDYEAHGPMAEASMRQIEVETCERWPIGAFTLVHRLGHLEVGAISVGVAVSCPHRAQAFEACRYAIDRLKEIVPIWKQEHWGDGRTEWVHPGLS